MKHTPDAGDRLLRAGRVNARIPDFHDTLTHSGGWQEILDRLICLFEARSGIICSLDTQRKGWTIIANSNLDPLALKRYESPILDHDIWPARLSNASCGVAKLSHELVPDHMLTRSRFYHHFLRNLNIFYGCEGFFANDRNNVAMVGLYRPAKIGCFRKADADLLTSLFPYLRGMLVMERQSALLTIRCETLYQIFDLLPFAVFVLSRSGEVIMMNGAAEQIVTNMDGFSLKYKTLVPVQSWQRAEFRSVFRNVVDPDGATQHEAVMKIFRKLEKRPLEVFITSLRNKGSICRQKPRSFEPAGIVLVCSTDVRVQVSADALMDLYALTPAEARITTELVRGKRISEIAKDLSLSEQTLRGELRNVFQKTETNRQAELISVILAGVAGFTEHSPIGEG